MRANIQAVSLKIQTLKSQNAMAQAMKGVTKAMMNMNKQMKLPEIQKIMQEFEKQSEIMDMKEEMMSDVIDDALGDEDDEEESDAIVSQVTEIVIVNWVTFTLQQVSNLHCPGSGRAGSADGGPDLWSARCVRNSRRQHGQE